MIEQDAVSPAEPGALEAGYSLDDYEYVLREHDAGRLSFDF